MGEAVMPPAVAEATRATGRTAASWGRPMCGLSAAERYTVTCTDRSRLFVKAATDTPTAKWLRTERTSLHLVGPALGPRVLAWRDGDPPLLVTECLDGYWPADDASGTTVWRPGDAEAVLDALERLRLVPVPPGLPDADWPAPHWAELVEGTALVEAGLCDAGWRDRHGAGLVHLDTSARRQRDAIVHGDVRSDNLCLGPDGTVRFVDWSSCGLGHRLQDLVRFLPTWTLEGGPEPAAVLAGPGELIVRLAGTTVRRALDPDVQPEWLRGVLLDLARISVRWVAAVLGVDPPAGARAGAN